MPGSWDADAILAAEPRAVLIANGPGDPAVLTAQVETIRALLGRMPLFGVCLGHQLLGLALGHSTFKLPFGHRGANHPGAGRARRAACSSPSRTTASRSLPTATCSHVSLNDGTCEGLAGDGFESVQFHPEASPGPLDALPFFDRLAETMPKRTDLRTILILGSGPIRIGQALRVRLLGRAGLPGAPPRGLPRRARQLEPGDDHDRPRMGRRDLPRAARRRDGRRR